APGVAVAPEVAVAASKDSGVVVVRGDSDRCAVAEVAAIADVASHQCGSNRECDSTCLVAAAVANHDLIVADVVALTDVALQSAAAVAVAAIDLRVAVNCESDPVAVVPSVAVVLANHGAALDVAVRNVLAVPDCRGFVVVPVVVVPSVADVLEN